MNILAARKYPNVRNGTLSLAEAETRRLAYAIKDPRSQSADFDAAAREMAALILASYTQPSTLSPQPICCWLIPIPDCNRSTRANAILAAHIARHVNANAAGVGAQVVQALRRTGPIESQCVRHRRNLPSTPPDEHNLKAAIWTLGQRQIYFVDNVATSGNTMRAAYAAMQRGAGLVFADAGLSRRSAAKADALRLF
jgi:hypothetical protein